MPFQLSQVLRRSIILSNYLHYGLFQNYLGSRNPASLYWAVATNHSSLIALTHVKGDKKNVSCAKASER